jgi:hypothetical protein
MVAVLSAGRWCGVHVQSRLDRGDADGQMPIDVILRVAAQTLLGYGHAAALAARSRPRRG